MKHLNTAYWARFFANNTTATYLPELRHVAPQHTGQIALPLEANLAQALQQMAGGNDLKLAIVLLSVYQCLLQEYNAQEPMPLQVSLPNPLTGQQQVPLFVPGLDRAPATSFKALLNQQKDALILALQHAEYDVEAFVKHLEKENIDLAEQVVCGFFMFTPPVQHQALQTALQLGLVKQEQSYQLQVHHSAEVPQAFAQNLATNYLAALQGLLQNLDQAPHNLARFMPTTLEAIAAYNSASQAQSPWLQQNLVQLFEQSVQQSGPKPALYWQEQQLSYTQLNEQVQAYYARLAHHCQLGTGQVVALQLSSSPELPALMLAALKAGATVLLIEKSLPQKRQIHCLADARTTWLITDLPTQEAPQGPWQTLTLSRLKALEAPAQVPPAPQVPVHQPAFVVYTSGSTGQPKGALLTHQNLANQYLGLVNYFNIEASMVMPQKAALSFVDCLTELLLPITVAQAAVYLRPYDHINQDAHQTGQWLQSIGVTLLLIVPSVCQKIDQEYGLQNLNTLQHLVLGGEPLDQYYANTGQTYNLYGCSECSSISTIYKITGPRQQGYYPVGQPFANVNVYILGPNHAHVPVGGVGELFVEGTSVCAGYLHAPQTTAQKFVDSPFTPGAKMYSTGDFARLTHQGYIEIIGRKDQQVKIRGMRIDLQSLEQALNQYPAVKGALALYHEQPQAGITVVLHAPETPRQELDNHVLNTLGSAYVPFKYVFEQKLKLNASGKLDRPHYKNQLPTYLAAQPEASVPLHTPMQEQVATIWQEALGPQTLGATNNFFDLGGNSILSAKITYLVYQQLGIELMINAIFTYPVLQDFAAHLEQLQDQKQEALQPAPQQDSYVLSEAQMRLWFLEQLHGHEFIYNMAPVLKVAKGLDHATLQQAFELLMARHEILRTSFVQKQGQVRQVIAEQVPFTLKQGQVNSLDQVKALHQEALHTPFDLTQAPLLRATLYTGPAQESYLLVGIHHLIVDYWGASLLFNELLEAYATLYAGQVPNWPPLPVQYKDFAHWEQQQLATEATEQQKAFWHKQLSPLPPSLPLPYANPHSNSLKGAIISTTYAPEVVQGLEQLSQARNISVHNLLITAVTLYLCRLTGQQDMVVGNLSFGRVHNTLERVAGCFLNILPVRHEVFPDQSFAANAEKVNAGQLLYQQHQEYPYNRLVQHFEQSANGRGLFDVMFNYLPQLPHNRSAQQAQGLELTELDWHDGISQFPLSFRFFEKPNGLALDLEYNETLLGHAVAQPLLQAFNQLLAQMVAQPENTAVQALPFNFEGPVQKQARVLNGGRNVPQPDVVRGWQKAAQTHASAVAVYCQEQTLTYAQTEQLSNKVAQALVQQYGIEPGQVVAYMALPNLHTVPVLLGILKAGAVYLPLNPAHPAHRVGHMLQQAKPGLLVAQGPGHWQETNYKGAVLLPEQLDQILQGPQASAPQSLPTPEQTAYIIYTSGTSGQPKGVMISHQSLANKIYTLIDDFAFAPGHVSMLSTELSFDPSIEQLFLPLLAGAKLVVPQPAHKENPDRFWQLVQQQKVNVINCVPSYADFLLTTTHDLAQVQIDYFLLGGDAFYKAQAQRLFDRLNPKHLYNMYGPTEATVSSTMFKVTQAYLQALPEKTVLPIGRPLGNYEVLVQGPNGQVLPMGQEGELLIGGAGVGQGYLHQEALTQQSFVPHPMHTQERVYRTGDVVRMDQQGQLHFLGRKDQQVKVNGIRIELNEIEKHLGAVPQVQDAVVHAYAEAHGQVLVGFYTSANAQNLPVAQIQQQLSQDLPLYMVPAFYHRLEAVPLTANGKVNRKALPSLENLKSLYQSPVQMPQRQVEKQLQHIWSQVLEVPVNQVGVNHNFFNLGGTSIKILTLNAAINETLQQQFNVATVFRLPTIRQQADFIMQQGNPENTQANTNQQEANTILDQTLDILNIDGGL